MFLKDEIILAYNAACDTLNKERASVRFGDFIPD